MSLRVEQTISRRAIAPVFYWLYTFVENRGYRPTAYGHENHLQIALYGNKTKLSKTSRVYRTTRGFSLLELMIVLVLMVGLLAIAWPNMQRSLRRTTLNEAAQLLREAIDEGRHEAIVTGRPVFVQMQQGNHEVRTGSFANFANDEDSLTSSGTELTTAAIANTPSPFGNRQELHADSKSPRKWRLPDSVVIAEVNWTTDSHSDTDETLGATSTSEPTSSQKLSDHPSTVSSSQSDSSISPSSSGTDAMLESFDGVHCDWWLPISATGQSRNASIILYDKSIHEKMTITYASDTGALEIVR